MDYDLECSGYNVRQFLGTVSTQGTLGELGNAVMTDILAVVDEVEQQTEAVLDGSNEEGWELFRKKVGVCATYLRISLMVGKNNLHVLCTSQSSADNLHDVLQDVGKKHGLDDFEKIKEQGVIEQVTTQHLCFHPLQERPSSCYCQDSKVFAT